MLNTAVLIVTILALLFGLKWFFKVLASGSTEAIVEKAEENLKKLKKDVNKKGAFVIAWFISLLLASSLIALSVYILTQKLNLV